VSKTSVIIPTHNRPELLPRAVESARGAGADVEIIVVDDASVDQTAQVCRSLEGVKYIRVDRNQGVAGARNIGVLESSGDYVAFLDDDDQRLPGSLDKQVAALEANSHAGFCCGGMIMADQNYQTTGEVILPRHRGPDVFWELLELDFPVMPLATLIRKECFFKIGLLRGRLSGIDDWDLFTRIAEVYPVIVLDEPMGVYRQPTATSGQGSSARAGQLRRAAHHQLELLKLPRALAASRSQRRSVRRRALNRIADTLLFGAAQKIVNRDSNHVPSSVLTALRLRPSRFVRPSAYKKFANLYFKPATNRIDSSSDLH
jgi:glycosyltransferase involved in cell wall biosynthesis